MGDWVCGKESFIKAMQLEVETIFTAIFFVMARKGIEASDDVLEYDLLLKVYLESFWLDDRLRRR